MQGFDFEEGSNIGTCRFSDDSSCDEFQYYSCKCLPGENSGVLEEATIVDSNEWKTFTVEQNGYSFDVPTLGIYLYLVVGKFQ
jgi:hypothetical protein